MNNKQYILKNKMTGRYLFSNFDDICFGILSHVIDIKEIKFANDFSEKELKELKKTKFFNKSFNINDYIITTTDIEIRRLKLENINHKREIDDYIENNFLNR